MTRYSMLFLLILIAGLGLATDVLAQAPDSDFRFSYALPRGNQTAILPDGTIVFPDTSVNTANPSPSQISTVTFVITNRGQVAGTVNNISASGPSFKVSGVPLLPAVVQPNQTLTFSIDFQPLQLGRAGGAL